MCEGHGSKPAHQNTWKNPRESYQRAAAIPIPVSPLGLPQRGAKGSCLKWLEADLKKLKPAKVGKPGQVAARVAREKTAAQANGHEILQKTIVEPLRAAIKEDGEETRATTKTVGDELHRTLAKQHAENSGDHAKTHASQGRIEATIGKHEPTINYHGDRSCSSDGQSPVKISIGEDNIIRAFLGKDAALGTRELEGCVPNVSEVMKKMAEKFPGAVRMPTKKGEGYFVRVKDARK